MNLTLISRAEISNNDSPETFKRALPVSVTDMQTHGRLPSLLIPPGDDPSYIEGLIGAATEQVEEYECRIQLLTAVYELTLDSFAGVIRIPRPPLQELLSVYYTDASGEEQPLYDTTSPLLDLGPVRIDGGNQFTSPIRPAEIYLADGQSWPTTIGNRNVLKIRFQCGFGDTAASVPSAIKQWIMIMASTMYEHREAEVTEGNLHQLKYVSGLLDPWRAEKAIA